MKTFLRTAFLICVTSAASLAQAATYNFTYEFNDFGKQLVTGSFTGDAKGKLITNLSDISLSYNGKQIGSDSWSVDNVLPFTSAWASLDGSNNNFSFTNGFLFSAKSFTYVTEKFSGLSTVTMGSVISPTVALVDIVSAKTTSWSVTQVSAVPEPETYAMLLSGLGLVGFAARRRKTNAVAA